ncbi:MAG: DUF2283 domain-containing protein [Candidatus Micrarchaeota archaeon]
MKHVNFDPDADALAVELSAKKAYRTIELTEHILIDVSDSGQVVGLEILDASEEISKIFGRVVSKAEIKQLLCQIRQKPNDEYLIQFSSPKKNNQVATYLFQLYRSPLIS